MLFLGALALRRNDVAENQALHRPHFKKNAKLGIIFER